MKVLSGHLTNTNKKAVKAIIDAGLGVAKVGRVTYFITNEGGIFTVKYQQMDMGLIPVPGSKLRLSTYSASFTL